MSLTKKLLIAGIAFVACGLILSGIAFAAVGFNVNALSTAEYVTNRYEFGDEIHNIKTDVTIADVSIARSSNGICSVECVEEKDDTHSVKVESGTLLISNKQNKKTAFHFAFDISTQTPKITILLPDEAYDNLTAGSDTGDVSVSDEFTFNEVSIKTDTGDVTLLSSVKENIKIETDTGDMTIKDISAADIDIKTDTGDTKMAGVECANLDLKQDTGELSMENVVASGRFNIKSSTGDVNFTGCDAAEIYVKTDTGDVLGSFLTDKVITTKTDTGDVNVPKSTSGGRCEVETDTGDIRLEIR